MELIGTIKKIYPVQTFASGFQKRELILMTDEQYPQPIKIEFLSENSYVLDHVQEGDYVEVNINLRGREWTNPEGETVYFNSITGWRLKKVNPSATSSAQNEPVQTMPAAAQAAPPQENPFTEEEDDLPF